MKICFIISNFNYHGGSQVIVNLAANLLLAEHDVAIVVIRSTKADLQSRPKTAAKVIDLFATNLLDGVIKLVKEIKVKKYDICHSLGLHANFILGLSSIVRSHQTKLIGSEHFASSPLLSHYTKPYLRFVRPLIKFAYGRLNGLIFVSDALREAFLQNNNFNTKKCVVIYNPIPVNSKYYKTFVRTKTKVILGLGILEARKRWDLLIDAVAILSKEIDCILLIGGTGSLQNSLRDQAKELRIEDKVRFLGYVSEPQSIMVKSDVLALTSDSEAFGMVLAEAMVVGTQVVSTDVFSGPREVLGHGKYGFLADKGDVMSIVSALRQACKNPLDKSVLAEAVERFEPNKIGCEYIQFFEEICASQGTIRDET
ncbi:glycosyltransferase [Amylibacter sp.]|nr:glycosyltransferase [Amylibacter sp.]